MKIINQKKIKSSHIQVKKKKKVKKSQLKNFEKLMN
jgi:hypothetical protein